MDALFWLLLPVAAISGWIAAFKYFRSIEHNRLPDVYDVSRRRAPNGRSGDRARNSSARNNSASVSSTTAFTARFANSTGDFVDVQPDKAVDIVIDKVEVNADTVEVHLALGNLYRRSGEVTRAIRFHQNLSEKHSLSHSQRESILFELGLDYLSAGLLDRAERIFKDLLTADEFKVQSSKALVEVFQQEKDWDEALEYAEMVEHLSKKSQKTRIAHYYCEKAEKINTDDGCDAAKALLLRALKKDKSCVRANILLGDMSLALTDYNAALKYYMSAVDQDRAFLAVVFDNLIQSYLLVTKADKLVSLMPDSLSSGFADTTDNAAHELPESLADQKINQRKAVRYIEQQLGKTPTLSLLSKYLVLSLDDAELVDRKAISQLKDALFKITKASASYKCVSCGLGVHSLHWQCPSCANWSTIKPL